MDSLHSNLDPCLWHPRSFAQQLLSMLTLATQTISGALILARGLIVSGPFPWVDPVGVSLWLTLSLRLLRAATITPAHAQNTIKDIFHCEPGSGKILHRTSLFASPPDQPRDSHSKLRGNAITSMRPTANHDGSFPQRLLRGETSGRQIHIRQPGKWPQTPPTSRPAQFCTENLLTVQWKGMPEWFPFVAIPCNDDWFSSWCII
jgi:hypothetical protein